jgi:hypothetical protein
VEGRGRRDAAASVLVTAMGDRGGAYFRGRVPEPSSRSGRGTSRRRREAAAAPPVTRVEFEADPGTLQLSLAIEGKGGEVLDRDRDEIEIPDFTGPDVVLGTPSFVRARNALELRQIVDDFTVVPIAGREFRRTDHLLVRVDAHAPGGGVADRRSPAAQPARRLHLCPRRAAGGRRPALPGARHPGQPAAG